MPGELHQISRGTNGETTPVAGDATGVLRCEPEASAERQSCHLNGDRDIGAKRQPGAGEIRCAGNADTSVGCDVDTAPYRLLRGPVACRRVRRASDTRMALSRPFARIIALNVSAGR